MTKSFVYKEKIYGGNYGQYGGGMNNAAMQEIRSDNWINQNIPGGVNSVVGERLDNYLGGNPNPTYGQIYGGAPGYMVVDMVINPVDGKHHFTYNIQNNLSNNTH